MALTLGLLAPWGLAAAQEARDGVAPIYHKEKSFRIPFDLDGQKVRLIKELQLWVSEDAGFNWDQISRATPDQKEFMFRARRDGEYWFAVRTMSSAGQLSPPADETIRPALKVIVDTRAPSLVLESDGRQGSVARVRWEARDENLDLRTLTLEYQVAGARDWKRVPLRRPAAVGSESWDAGTVESVRVRGTVADRAGNVQETEVSLSEGASVPPDMASLGADVNAPPVRPIGGRSRSPIQADSSFTPVEDPAGPASAAASAASQRGAEGWGAEAGRRPIARQARAGSDALVNSSPPAPDWDSATNSNSGADAFEAAPPPEPPADFSTPSRPPGFSDPFAAEAPAAAPTTPEAEAGGGEIPTMLVGGPRFRLKYDIQDAGPDGKPAIVELWVTRNGGRSWSRLGADDDRVSPFDVSLPDVEGTIGLTLVAQSSSGQGDLPPAPGDRPDIWVEIDSTPPRVHLYPPQIGSGQHAGKIAIAWRAEDAHLGEKPVSLFWRPDRPGDPWVAIADAQGREGVGQFVWAVPPNFPPRFHVRVEVVDEAGNKGFSETPEGSPVIVDRSRPRGKIIGLDTGDAPSARVSR
ncbi:hypothetical protein [Paludisphaera sp.]|uniref:hypothetical protein n=1 Tax=Paludisphaera sp. TaxID=2017432 RepID=UPI00301C2CF5